MVPPEETAKYKITTAIGELYLGQTDETGLFAGVIYPSVRMWANGDNVGLLPSFVDKHLIFKKAIHIRIDRQVDTQFSITSLDSARDVDARGCLNWSGNEPHWSLPPGCGAKFMATPGPDSDGDYEIGGDGTPCHWEATELETGVILKPK
jgi:hypothetical protein